VAEFGHGAPEKKVVEIRDPGIQQKLLVLEEQEVRCVALRFRCVCVCVCVCVCLCVCVCVCVCV
jgi:hypothetical protein